MFENIKKMFSDPVKAGSNSPLTEEEQLVIMQDTLHKLSNKARLHEDTKKVLREAISVYGEPDYATKVQDLPIVEAESFAEELHKADGGTKNLSRPQRSVGTTEDIVIKKYMINPDYRAEILYNLEEMFFTDEHLGGAAKKIVKMLSVDFKLNLKYEDNTVLKSKILRELECLDFGDKNIYTDKDEIAINESNNTAINNMALQLVITGAIGRAALLTEKPKVVGTTPLDLKHVRPYITKEGNIEWVQRFETKQNTFNYLTQLRHDGGNMITDPNIVLNPYRGADYNGVLDMDYTLKLDGTSYIPLNKERFIYQPAITYQDNPIGVPPFLTALASAKLERSMLGGVANYSERFNAVSFVTVLVRPITAKNGESRDAYAARVNDLLTKVTEKIDNGFRNGYFIGFTGVHDIKIDSTQADATGFNILYKWAVVNKASGLGIPPLLLGVETQVSESLARILVQTMLAELKEYQDALGDALLKFFNFYLKINQPAYALRMREKNIKLELKFKNSSIEDNLRAEQAKALEVNRLVTLVNQGIISNDDMAIELGYEKAHLKNPPVAEAVSPNKPLAKKKKGEPNTNDKPSRSKINEFKADVFEYLETYGLVNKDTFWDKDHAHEVDWEVESFAEKTDLKKNLFDLITQLQKEVVGENVAFNLKLKKLLNDFLIQYENKEVSYPVFVAELVTFIGEKFEQYFDYSKISQNMINTFQTTNVPNIIKKTQAKTDFLNQDFHNYFKNVSDHYLGKFISNPATVKAINDYLVEKVVTNEIIVFDEKVMNDIKAIPNTVLNLQDYQLKRVISTTVSRYQNAGIVAAFNDIGVTEMQVVSVNSFNTCAYCKQLHGTIFSVPNIHNRYSQVINSNILEDLQLYTPFVNSLYSKVEAMPKDAALLALSGVAIPFHSHCQCMYQVV